MASRESGSLSVMIVDDDACTRAILQNVVRGGGYETTVAQDGMDAWLALDREPDRYHAILLDVMMPRLSGIDLLRQLKKDVRLRMIPVILATARTAREDVLEGLNAGAYYYLTKPFDIAMVLAVVNVATAEYSNHLELLEVVQRSNDTMRFIKQGRFAFRTLADGDQLATCLAKCCPDPAKVVIGLSELFINAIEHGNLGLTYEQKSALSTTAEWRLELERRMMAPENRRKVVTVDFARSEEELTFTIRDDGDGFDWRPYDDVSLERAFDAHGRGIVIARTVSFDSVTYHGKGNQVQATVKLREPSSTDSRAEPGMAGLARDGQVTQR